MKQEDVEAVVEFCMTKMEKYSREKRVDNSVKVRPDDSFWMSLEEDDHPMQAGSRHYRNLNKEAWKAIAVKHFCK